MNSGSPYDSGASSLADAILRSSDSVDFYILSAFLRYVSPIFKDMFASCKNDTSEETDDEESILPVIPLAEDGQTIRLLLDFIYPYEDEPQLIEVAVCWEVGKATQKYCMDMIENKLRKRVLASDLVGKNPLSMYALATDLGWEDLAVNAARMTLDTPLKNLPYVDELKGISGTGFYRFLEYRLRCNKSESPRDEELATFQGSSKAESDTDSQPLVDASAPFDCSAISDLILRSSDQIDFFVVGALLRLTSPSFHIMFPLKDQESRDGYPVVHFDGNSEVLSHLLDFIYPCVDNEDIQDCSLFFQVVLTARKYKMETVEKRLRKQASSFLVSEEPLRMYAVASVLGWQDLARAAAFNTFLWPLEEMTYVDELKLIDGAVLYRLMRCADAACTSLEKSSRFLFWGFCRWSYRGTTSAEVLYEKIRTCPRGPTVRNLYRQELKELAKCGDSFNMSYNTFSNILQNLEVATNVVEDAIRRIPFEVATLPNLRSPQS